MFISPYASNFKRPAQSLKHSSQPQFSGFDKKGAFYKVADELDTVLLTAEDAAEPEGQTQEEILLAAEKARKAYDTKPYEVKFIKALVQDVVDHFKSSKEPIPAIPAAKMVKNAIAWMVAYGEGNFDIKEYKPPKAGNKAGYIYRTLLDSEQETIPWPAKESAEQKAGWPISDTPIDELQGIFDTELTKATQGRITSASKRTGSAPSATPAEQRRTKATPSSARTAASKSPATERQIRQSSRQSSAEARSTVSVGVQTLPELLSVKVTNVAESIPSEPMETSSAQTQTLPESLSVSKVTNVAESIPSEPVETENKGVQVNMPPRKIILSPTITPVSPHVTTLEDEDAEDIVDWEDSWDFQELEQLVKSKPGTKNLHTWFSLKYKGDDPRSKAIAFSRFTRDLHDPAGPINENNLFSYLEKEGFASPEPEDINKLKRKATDTPLDEASNPSSQ